MYIGDPRIPPRPPGQFPGVLSQGAPLAPFRPSPVAAPGGYPGLPGGARGGHMPFPGHQMPPQTPHPLLAGVPGGHQNPLVQQLVQYLIRGHGKGRIQRPPQAGAGFYGPQGTLPMPTPQGGGYRF